MTSAAQLPLIGKDDDDNDNDDEDSENDVPNDNERDISEPKIMFCFDSNEYDEYSRLWRFGVAPQRE